ncbi:MAG TPA: nuclear transport factor 2 family protein [Burkholderiaceae bacterium]|nr:nuclear transport factor 2 family protein [Burkholderiaceae bacterium]
MPRLAKPMLFASAEECEQAFYDALENADVEAMAELWLQDDDVCCTHPGAARLVGYNAVRSSWASILESGPLPIRTLARQSYESATLAVTNLVEELVLLQGTARQLVHVIASNAFVKTPAGWKMVMHVGAPAPQGQAVEVEVPSGTVH